MKGEYGEPWKLAKPNEDGIRWAVKKCGTRVFDERDRKRSVACVNALAGIPDDQIKAVVAAGKKATEVQS